MQQEINKLEKVIIGEIEQWMLIRGRDVSNPILLFLHGGPGFPAIPFANGFDKRIEEHFTVVYWDQRGAGKSYSEAIPEQSMKIEQFVLDAIELVKLLRVKFKKDKVYLLGHSWGAMLGMYMIYRYPENFFAYIGMGQVVECDESRKIAYHFVLEHAKKIYDLKAIEELTAIGKPPYVHPEDPLVTYKYIVAYGGALYNACDFSKVGYIAGSSEEYTQQELELIDKGSNFSNRMLLDEYSAVNLFEEIKEVKVPIYFCSGKMDYLVPFEVTYQYFNELEAPSKEFIWFDKSAHFPFFEEPEKLYELLYEIKRKLCITDSV